MDGAEDTPDEAPVFVAGDDAAGTRLDAWLAAASGRSRAAVQRLLAEGFVEDAATGAALGRDAAKRRVAPGDAFEAVFRDGAVPAVAVGGPAASRPPKRRPPERPAAPEQRLLF